MSANPETLEFNENDIWATDINNPRPPQQKFNIGFECGDADPDLFNWLFHQYSNYIKTLYDNTIDLLPRVRVLEQFTADAVKAPNSLSPTLQRVASTAEVNEARNENGNTTARVVMSLAQIMSEFATIQIRGLVEQGSGVLSVSQDRQGLTPRSITEYLYGRGALHLYYTQSSTTGLSGALDNELWKIWDKPNESADNRWILPFANSRHNARGIWVVQWYRSTDAEPILREIRFDLIECLAFETQSRRIVQSARLWDGVELMGYLVVDFDTGTDGANNGQLDIHLNADSDDGTIFIQSVAQSQHRLSLNDFPTESFGHTSDSIFPD